MELILEKMCHCNIKKSLAIHFLTRYAKKLKIDINCRKLMKIIYVYIILPSIKYKDDPFIQKRCITPKNMIAFCGIRTPSS